MMIGIFQLKLSAEIIIFITMKAITLHPTATGGIDTSVDSKDRRTSSSANGDQNSAGPLSSNTGGGNNASGIVGLGNIDGTVHHYELPNLAQRKQYID